MPPPPPLGASGAPGQVRAHNSSTGSLNGAPRKRGRNGAGSSGSELLPPSVLGQKWALSTETLSPQKLERTLHEVPRDSLNLAAYDHVADDLIKSMGAKDALKLTLALLRRSVAAAPAAQSRPAVGARTVSAPLGRVGAAGEVGLSSSTRNLSLGENLGTRI